MRWRALLTGYPDAFKGTELDVEASRQKMEKLCARVEGFLADAAPAPAGSSQALAEMLREALASNTIGGRAGEEAKWRAMADEVRQAQASWSRLGAGAWRRRPAAHRAFPQGVQPVLRTAPPQSAAAAGSAARGRWRQAIRSQHRPTESWRGFERTVIGAAQAGSFLTLPDHSHRS